MEKRQEKYVDPHEMERQYSFIEKIIQLNKQEEKIKNRSLKAMVTTYGCQQNESDSERIRGMLTHMGYSLTHNQNEADLVLYNTCAIRENAELKVFGKVGELVSCKRENPSMIVALCGCMMQQEHVAKQIKEKYRHVDLVFGTHGLHRFPEFLYQTMKDRKRIFQVSESMGQIAENIPVSRMETYKAKVSIMFGCNNFCTYCVVPYVRGRERSRMPEKIIDEIRRLVDDNVKDITLLGQNVNSYGRDLEGEIDFPGLLEKINEIEGDFRFRFMTSHPKDATQKLFDAIARCSKMVRHVHLPFQAGNNRILEKMNRGYTKEEYLEKIKKLRQTVEGIAITSDIIVGFPTETDQEFEDTLDVVRQVEFDSLYTFIFSRRKGTPAFDMEGQIGKEVQHRRFERLIEEQTRISKKINDTYLNTVQRVLIEGPSRNDPTKMSGRTDSNKVVHLAGTQDMIGRFVPVRITEVKTWYLVGEALTQ